MGLRLLDPTWGSAPWTPAGGSAPRPPLYARAPALATSVCLTPTFLYPPRPLDVTHDVFLTMTMCCNVHAFVVTFL